MSRQTTHYLILPGWQGSPDEHWQSHWQRSLPNASRVEQADWLWPDAERWVAALEQRVATAPAPLILVAHSLGCITLARWAAQASASALDKVRGALLVAPADVERANCPEALRGFAPIPRDGLPFPSLLVGSDNDPAASAERASQMARDWGAEALILPGAGHINVASGHCRWEQGFAYLYRLQQQIEQHARRRA
ncbi:alpha/beta hydrolase [Pseudomonas sp. GOM6]|uniref:RBBP9/YdeN family alpha/beta hydrolase n=1 Tax=Pseudomonas sp. GOM6 TaxID=3036944 RepID=UPI0024099FF2|nr:alpha/beta hydrolase [Pseudomonas sp. GOM6]MDG1579516.1 alpha/beta hydrolase [Pseudomonas sp. GOM6]